MKARADGVATVSGPPHSPESVPLVPSEEESSPHRETVGEMAESPSEGL